jgi:hypothetical protein
MGIKKTAELYSDFKSVEKTHKTFEKQISKTRKLPFFSNSLGTNFLVSSFFVFFPQFQSQHTILGYSVKIKISENKVLWLYKQE